MKESFSTSEVARYCHVTADTIRKWAEAGRISVFKTPGGHRRIRREDLVRFLVDNQIPIHAELMGDATKVLVVTPDDTVIDTVRAYLETVRSSYQLDVARDSFEAGCRVAVNAPDVVFVDWHVPGSHNGDLCRRIKSHDGLARTAIVALTPSDAGVQQGDDPCASFFLPKPLTHEGLHDALDAVGIALN